MHQTQVSIQCIVGVVKDAFFSLLKFLLFVRVVKFLKFNNLEKVKKKRFEVEDITEKISC